MAMPDIFEKDITKVQVKLDELIPNWFPSEGALRIKIYRNQKHNYGIKRLQRGGGTGTEVLIDFDTLPREIQESLGDPRKHAHIMEKWYKTDADAVRFFADFKFENGVYLDGKFQKEYIINANVLLALRTYWEAHEAELTGKGKKAKKKYDFLLKESEKFRLTLKAKYDGTKHTLQGSEKRFKQAYDQFFTKPDYPNPTTGEMDLKYDYRSLISGKIQNENAKIVTSALTALLDSLFAKGGTKPNKIQVARRYQSFLEGHVEVINNETGELYNPKDFVPIGNKTIVNWLSSYESKMGTLALRSADRQRLRELTSVAHERERPLYAGSLISVDDRQPPFEYGPSQRIWLYNCLDVASDAITATVYGKSKEGMILDFYRQILRNYTQWGIRLPAELEAETSLNASFKDTFLKEGAMFSYVRLEANNARGKIIENRNREFRLNLEKEIEGWIGRPFAKDESNQALPKDNMYAAKKYQPYQTLVENSLKVIEDWNNMPHPVKPEMSRWDYFMSMQNEQLHATNWRAILPHLGFATYTSCNVGKIQLQGQFNMLGDNGEIFFGDSLISLLKRIEGKDVNVYWLDGNDGKVLKALVYVGDTYICEAIPTPKYNHARIERTEQDDINLAIQSKYTATVEGYLNSRKNSIERVIVLDNTPKTLNRNFKMPGFNRYFSVSDSQPVETLPELPEMQEVPVNHEYTRRLADRF